MTKNQQVTNLNIFTHFAYNTYNLGLVGIDYVDQRLGLRKIDGKNILGGVDFHDPFVKNSFFDLLMPPVPFDRLTRGWIYLDKHGNKMITLQDLK